MGTVGVTPKLKEKIFERLESELGVKLPSFRGFDTLECLEAAERGIWNSPFALEEICMGQAQMPVFRSEHSVALI